MAFIACKKKNGRAYFCKVESYREAGKIKQRVLEYYGVHVPRKEANALPITKKSAVATYRFGDIALLYLAADSINMIDVINKYVPKRQGLPLGMELFLTVAHRLLGDKPSSANLSRWVNTTHLPLLLNFDAERISSNTQSYLMDKLYDREHNIDHILRISTELYGNALRLFGKKDDVFFYDITSTYFEGKSCMIAKMGYNRDGNLDKLQINIGMVANGNYGIPLMTKVFEGNVNDAETVYEMVYYTKFVIGKKKGLLIMDRGMDSEDNIRILDTVKYDYIVGLRSNHGFVDKLKKKTDADTTDWSIFDNDGENIKIKKFSKNVFGKRRNIILYYSSSIAKSQSEYRQIKINNAVHALEKVKKLNLKNAEGILNGVKKYFVLKKEKGKISWRIDKTAINKAERYDGKFCLITNLDMPAGEVYKLYFSKDMIEKGFRHMKQDIALHPTRKRLVDRVIMDVFICHLAYTLLKVTEHQVRQKKIDIFWDAISSETKEIRLLESSDLKGRRSFQIIPNNEIQRSVVDAFQLTDQIPSSLQNRK